jgi:competence protein ComEA
MKIDFVKTAVIGAGMILAFSLGMGVIALRNRESPAPIEIRPPEPTPTELPTATPSPILVYISGEVVMPDVYTLPADSRIKQLIEAAGGFKADADMNAVNLAQPLADGVHVYVPAKGEPIPPGVLSSPVPQRGSSGIDLGTGGDLININTADMMELDELPGIGPVTAQKILDYRTLNGPFATIEAIMEVSGIGQGTYDKLKELITTGN